MRLCGHFGPQQYTTISAVLGKFVLRTSLPTLSRGTRCEPKMFSPLNHSSVRTFQNWMGRWLFRVCRSCSVETVFMDPSVKVAWLMGWCSFISLYNRCRYT